MKRSLTFQLCAVLIFAPAWASAPNNWIPPTGDWLETKGWRLGTFASETAGCEVGYYIYLPPDYATEKDRRYPVVYWLHGLNGSPASANPIVERLDKAIKAGDAPKMILVSCTDPTKQSMWTDSKDRRVPVETVIVRDLIPHVDATYRTIADRRMRAIEGYSMGGYGAAFLGFKYPHTFGVVSVLAGALHTPESLRQRRAAIYERVFGGDSAYADANSPWQFVRRNVQKIRGKTHIRIHVGDRDALKAACLDMSEMLFALHIEHTFTTSPNATHNSAEVYANWPGNMFDFYNIAFAAITD